jgi:hypothetical protein
MAVVFCCLSSTTRSNPVWEWTTENIAILPDASFDGDYKKFVFQKNRTFRKYYQAEANLNADIAFVGVMQRFYFMFRGELHAGLGESPFGMLLHPFLTSYATTPFLEYRFDKIHVSAGLDHRCFHYVDVLPPDPIVYWNKFYITINSPHRRSLPFVTGLLSDEGWRGFNRLVWSFSWGYYINEFFDMMPTYKLMSVDGPYYFHDFQLNAQYGLARWGWGAVALTDATLFGVKRKGKGSYWAQETGLEVLLAHRFFDTSLFVNYILDEGRFNSKDRLLEFGIRLYK